MQKWELLLSPPVWGKTELAIGDLPDRRAGAAGTRENRWRTAQEGRETPVKILKKIAAAALVLCLLAGLAPAALSAGETEETAQYEEKSFEDIMRELLEKFDAEEESVCAGYLNLVTGEEHYWRGDESTVAASMYKVPLNMLIAEKISTGELVWEEKYPNLPYEEVLQQTILYSSNQWAQFLWMEYGSYADYRRAIAPYMGIDTETVDEAYFENNEFTPRQMIHCLKLLYDETDRFPKILETMKQAEPERFFRYSERRFEIAHKYGYVPEWSDVYMNDCGIVFTDEPIALVMFTKSVWMQEELLSAFCTAMCDYTQYHTALRREEAEETAREKIKTRETEPLVAPVPREGEKKTEEGLEGTSMRVVLCCAAIAILAVAAAVTVILRGRKNGIRPFWVVISVFLCTAALLLCVIGSGMGTLYAKPDGDPAETADEFLTALTGGDYETAYTYLRDYTSLGLENEPESEAGKTVYSALRESYDYELVGACSAEKLDAKQKLRFTYLDLTGIRENVESETMEQLRKLVKERPRDEVYDENDQYRQEITDEAYLRAVKSVLREAKSYYTTQEIELTLAYSDGRWQVIVGQDLLRALNGGTGF